MENNIEFKFNLRKHSGLGGGYYPEPSKIVIIVHPDNLETGKKSSYVMGLRLAMASGILEVLLGMPIPNGIGCRITR